MKLFDKSDEQFVSASKSESKRSELIKRTSQTRTFSMVAVACGGFSCLVSFLMKQPQQPWLYGMLLYGMIMGLHADQQIKMLKCLNAEETPEEA